jgi:hypothetical protein
MDVDSCRDQSMMPLSDAQIIALEMELNHSSENNTQATMDHHGKR